MTRKPQGAKEPNESTSCMFFRCMFMYKVLLEFLEFLHPRLLLDSPAIRLHMALAQGLPALSDNYDNYGPDSFSCK